MSDKERIQKILERAIKGGWLCNKNRIVKKIFVMYEPNFSPGIHVDIHYTKRRKNRFWNDGFLFYCINDLIFNHDFAKAFWGEEGIKEVIYDEDGNKGGKWIIAWKYRLQQMVLEKEPLRYLEKFLDK